MNPLNALQDWATYVGRDGAPVSSVGEGGER
jgi:hypothetical protein